MKMKHIHYKSSLILAAWLLTGLSNLAGASELNAVLVWPDKFIASFPMDGGVRKVHVRPGDRVSKGARLIELDTEPVQIRVRQYEAELAAREPALIDTRREFEQARTLYEQTVLSDVQLQKAQLAYDTAKAEVAAARARLEHARWQLKKSAVVAPWDAIVIERNVNNGEMLVAEHRSKPLLVIARTDLMGASATLPLADAASVKTGQSAEVQVGGKVYPARIIEVGIKSDANRIGDGYHLLVEFDITGDIVYTVGQAAMIRLD